MCPFNRVTNGAPFDDRLFAANRATGTVTVTVVDVSDIEKPKLIEQFDTPGNPGRIQVYKGQS